MDRKTILEKGFLLGYLLDELSGQEKVQVEKALKEDESLRREFERLEAGFEDMAMKNAIAPPPSVKTALRQVLEKEGQDSGSGVRSLNPKSAYNPVRLMVAASLAALFALSTFWLYTRWQGAEENLRLVQEEQQELRMTLGTLASELQEVKDVNAKLNDRNTTPFILEGNSLAPEARAVAFVNHQDRIVMINPKGLPVLGEDETYQMWADVDGEMINMRLLPTDQDLVSLTYIDRAESLNITIEPQGGSDHPTVERLITNVYL